MTKAIKKFRIRRNYRKEEKSQDLQQRFIPQQLVERKGFFTGRITAEWEDMSYRTGYGEYTWRERYKFDTEKEAREFIKKCQTPIPADEIIEV